MSQKYEYMFRYFKGKRCVGRSICYDTLDEAMRVIEQCGIPSFGITRVLFRRPVCEWEEYEIGKDKK